MSAAHLLPLSLQALASSALPLTGAVSGALPAGPAVRTAEPLHLPPCPDLIVQLRTELAQPEPRMEAMVRWIAADVDIALALIKAAHSACATDDPRRHGTLKRTLERLGPRRSVDLLSAVWLPRALPAHGPSLDGFWDFAQRRSLAMAWLAHRHGGVDPDVAQAFGLCCDAGILILALRFLSPSYRVTLAEANLGHRPFTEIERARHDTDHTEVGAALAEAWGLPGTVVRAVRHHHDHHQLAAADDPTQQVLVALGLLADRMIHLHQGRNRPAEWWQSGMLAMHVLQIDQQDFEQWRDELRSHLALVA